MQAVSFAVLPKLPRTTAWCSLHSTTLTSLYILANKLASIVLATGINEKPRTGHGAQRLRHRRPDVIALHKAKQKNPSSGMQPHDARRQCWQFLSQRIARKGNVSNAAVQKAVIQGTVGQPSNQLSVFKYHQVCSRSPSLLGQGVHTDLGQPCPITQLGAGHDYTRSPDPSPSKGYEVCRHAMRVSPSREYLFRLIFQSNACFAVRHIPVSLILLFCCSVLQ
jgi:hypothetical protein